MLNAPSTLDAMNFVRPQTVPTLFHQPKMEPQFDEWQPTVATMFQPPPMFPSTSAASTSEQQQQFSSNLGNVINKKLMSKHASIAAAAASAAAKKLHEIGTAGRGIHNVASGNTICEQLSRRLTTPRPSKTPVQDRPHMCPMEHCDRRFRFLFYNEF